MRHGIAGKKLGRKSTWRAATVRDLAKATLVNQRICTTRTKAKEARKLVDQLITLGKKGSLAHKRRAFAILSDHKLVSELFNTTAPRFKSRAGGYTRIIPLSYRRGDHAQLAYLELTEKDREIISKSRSAGTGTKDSESLDEAQKSVAKTKVKKAKTKKAKEEKAEVVEAEAEAKPKPKKATKKDTKATTKKQDDAKPKKTGGLKKIFKKSQKGS